MRRSLAEEERELSGVYDGNPKRSTARPSAELILDAFDDITMSIRYDRAGEEVERYLTPLDDVQERILELLGLSPEVYRRLTNIPVAWSSTQGEVRLASVGVG